MEIYKQYGKADSEETDCFTAWRLQMSFMQQNYTDV